MKKFFIILLLLVYGFSSTGMTINFHYCCGKLKRVDWVAATEKNCGTKHKMGAKPCCETKQISGKHKVDQEQVQAFVKQVKSFSAVLHPATEKPVAQRILRPLSPVAFAPPPLSSPPLFLLHCVYRI